MMRNLYEIATNSVNLHRDDPDWSADFPDGFCPWCRSIDRTRYPRPVDVGVWEIAESNSCGRLSPFGVPLVRADLIEALRPHMDAFVFGRCLDSEGEVIADYVTCYTKDCIVSRGDKATKYYLCEECGSVVSIVTSRPYVLRRELTEAQVYQEEAGNLYLAADVALGIDWSPWPDLLLRLAEIRDKPIDGRCLPGDPPGEQDEYLEGNPLDPWDSP